MSRFDLRFLRLVRRGERRTRRRAAAPLEARAVRVVRQLNEQRGGGFVFGPPKSEAGRRTVAIPEVITADVASHLK